MIVLCSSKLFAHINVGIFYIGLGKVYFAAVCTAVTKQQTSNLFKRTSYKEYNDNDKFSIDKHASLYGVAPPLRK